MPIFYSSKCRLFHNATLFGFCITHILNTGCAKIWKKIRRQKIKQAKQKATWISGLNFQFVFGESTITKFIFTWITLINRKAVSDSHRTNYNFDMYAIHIISLSDKIHLIDFKMFHVFGMLYYFFCVIPRVWFLSSWVV